MKHSPPNATAPMLFLVSNEPAELAGEPQACLRPLFERPRALSAVKTVEDPRAALALPLLVAEFA
jgi:hypothetical protein